MPPRGSEGYDFTPILTHYLFLFTSILAVVGWWVAFIAQAVATATIGRSAVNVLWFAIFVQLFLILGVLHTLASDTIAMHRLQISVFGAIAIVFAVFGVNDGIFTGSASLDAMAAGWLILAVVDIVWVLYFTSEEDSLIFHLFNTLGTGGLTPPSRRRRTRGQSIHGMGGTTNGYAGPGGGYGAGSGVVPYDSKAAAANSFGPGVRSQPSFNAGSVNDNAAARSVGGGGGPGSVSNVPTTAGGGAGTSPENTTSPLMGPNGALGAGSPDAEHTYKAKALYTYSASPDDPNEISFTKGDVLDILDKNGKWWQARKLDGTVGIAPSNYLQII